MNEPILFRELKKHNNAQFSDNEQEVIEFLREQYYYEKNRIEGLHNAFKNTYKLSYFSVNEMLNYYMNPWGNEKERYFINELEYPNIIFKQTK